MNLLPNKLFYSIIMPQFSGNVAVFIAVGTQLVVLKRTNKQQDMLLYIDWTVSDLSELKKNSEGKMPVYHRKRPSRFNTCTQPFLFIRWWSVHHLKFSPFFYQWCHSVLFLTALFATQPTTVIMTVMLSLNSGLGLLCSWGSNNEVAFNAPKNSLLPLSLKCLLVCKLCFSSFR